jgi:hypothetical protein
VIESHCTFSIPRRSGLYDGACLLPRMFVERLLWLRAVLSSQHLAIGRYDKSRQVFFIVCINIEDPEHSCNSITCLRNLVIIVVEARELLALSLQVSQPFSILIVVRMTVLTADAHTLRNTVRHAFLHVPIISTSARLT